MKQRKNRNYNQARKNTIIFAVLIGLLIMTVLAYLLGPWSLVVTGLLFSWTTYVENSWLKMHHIKLPAQKIERQLKILQVSDFHSNPLTLHAISSVILTNSPDVVVLTGDIFDGEKTDNSAAHHLIHFLHCIDVPVLMIYGNHEMDYPHFLKQVDAVIPETIIRLHGQSRQVKDVVLYGANYAQSVNFQPKKGYFNILLTHTPAEAENYVAQGFDLILCGHEHGGQVRLPLIGAVTGAKLDLFSELRGKKTRGLYRKDGTQIYIDSGSGWSTLPVRFGCRVQVTIIELEPIKN